MDCFDFSRLVKEADLLKVSLEILEGSDANVSPLCYKAMVQVGEMKEGLQTLKILLDKQKAQIETCKELLATVHHIGKVTEHIENNLPAKYFCSTECAVGTEKVSESNVEYPSTSQGPWTGISPYYCASSSNKRVVHSPGPYITYLKLEEFDKIPKYMKGRLTYEMVNNFIDAFNMALEKKYQLFSCPRSTLKGKKLMEYDAFKKQETRETIEKGIYFCVADDLKRLGNIKMDKASYNLLNILRNAQCMREIRTPGVVRYALLN